MPSGRIIKGIGGFYSVRTDEGHIFECKARGLFRKDGIVPLPGDFVVFESSKETGCKRGCESGSKPVRTGWITDIHPRRHLMVRPAIANADQAVVVISIDMPPPDFVLIDKLLAISAHNMLDIAICVSKIDLDKNDSIKIIGDIYRTAGYNVVETCCINGMGIDRLKEIMKDKLNVFAGQSGVGKSTLLNMLAGSLIMETGSLSVKSGRGKHVTRHTELILLESGGMIADTPGFSSYELEGIGHERLKDYYIEFIQYSADCRFKGCNHIKEPGCGVKDAVNRGIINCGRYERYIYLFNELKKKKAYENKS